MNATKENKMGHAPMLKLILSMSIPSMISMLVQAMYNIVDSMFVSWYSQEALTAVSLAFPIQFLLIAMGVGTGVGINSLVSRRLGQKRKDEANAAATHGFFLGIGNWLIFLVFGLFFAKPFMSLFSTNQTVVQMGTEYLAIACIFSFGSMLQLTSEKTLQATGNMVYPMVAQLLGAVINIILDPIFIFGWLFVPEMGVAGAAIATIIGQVCAMVYLVCMLFFKQKELHVSLKGFQFRLKTVKDIYSVGLPSIIMQSIGSVMIMGMNGILATFSDAAVSVLGVYQKLQSFVFMPVFGLTHGLMPIMGYNYGAKNKKRLLSALKLGVIIAFMIMFVGMLLFLLFPAQLLGIFKADDELLRIGVPALRIICLCFCPGALGIALSTCFQAIGQGVKSLIISLLRQLVLILPVAFILSRIGLSYVWWAFPIAEACSCVISLFFLKQVYNKQIKQLGEV